MQFLRWLTLILLIIICVPLGWFAFLAAANLVNQSAIKPDLGQAGAAVVQAVFALILIAITGIYAWLTSRSVEQGRDALRPILVPRSHPPRIAGRNEYPPPQEADHVTVLNIGAGAALNGRCRLEEGFKQDAIRRPTDITESRTVVRPLGAGEQGLVYNYNSSQPNEFQPYAWLTISYDDVYGRHFETEAQWNGVEWVNIAVREVSQPRPYFNPELPKSKQVGF